MIFANILHVHFDQTYWENPEDFNPSRFIDEKTQTFINEIVLKSSILYVSYAFFFYCLIEIFFRRK